MTAPKGDAGATPRRMSAPLEHGHDTGCGGPQPSWFVIIAVDLCAVDDMRPETREQISVGPLGRGPEPVESALVSQAGEIKKASPMTLTGV